MVMTFFLSHIHTYASIHESMPAVILPCLMAITSKPQKLKSRRASGDAVGV